jgi:isopenicillin-N epimerase
VPLSGGGVERCYRGAMGAVSAAQRAWADLWQLDPDVVFLNHGSFGACPRGVLAVQAELRARMEANPVAFLHRELEPRLDAARAELAAFTGAAPEDLAFVPNATTAVNAVLRSLELGRGDELLVTDHEYPACRNALDHVAAATGARVVVAPLPLPVGDPEEVVEAVLRHVTPRTRLVLVDHVTSQTALVLPVERLVRELDRRGVDTLVDGAHAPGMLPLDLAGLGAAYVAGNCHKWLCAPKGAGFLHVRRDRQGGVRPTVISHGATSGRADRSRFLLEFDWTGTVDPTPWLCTGEAIRFMGGLLPGGWRALMTRNRDLAVRARSILAEVIAGPALAPEAMLGAMAAVALPGAGQEPEEPLLLDPLQRRLGEGWRIEVPVIRWQGRRLLRISAQLYNDEGQFRLLASALARLREEEATRS